MYGDWDELGRLFIGLLAVGFVIKMVDDALDAEYDICRGQRTLAVKWGRAALPYTIIMVLLAAWANLQLTFAAFLGSYAVGMFINWRETLPTRVPAYVETILMMSISVLLVGWRNALWGLAMMCVIDWLDDVIDRWRDHDSGQLNMVHRFGIVEVLLATLVALCTAIFANPEWSILTFIAVPILTIFFEATTTQLLI